MKIDALIGRLEGAKLAGKNRWMARCPTHQDRRQSLSVASGETAILLKCFAGCETSAILGQLGLKAGDLFYERRPASHRRATAPTETVYPYRDEKGRPLFEVVRSPGKKFHQRRIDPANPRRWIPKLGDVRRVPYRLPELLAAARDQIVFVTEGEKDADNLRERLQLVATTNPGGTGNSRIWKDPQFVACLVGRSVVVLPDNDPPGRDHAERVAAAVSAVAAKMRVLPLPGLPPKGDVSDWIGSGGTTARLLQLVEACPIHEAKPATTDDDAADGERREIPSEAQRIVELALPHIELFQNSDEGNEAFASIRCPHQETWPVGSRQFRLWLTRMVYRAKGKVPRANGISEAISALEAVATFDGKSHSVATRVGHLNDATSVDLGSPSWRVVEITRSGWRVMEASGAPVRFRRTTSMLSLPEPEAGGSLAELRKFLNVDEDTFRLLVAWLTFAFQLSSPFPILVLQGEQGSAKSTTARVLKSLVDPSRSELRVVPKQEADLMIAAKNCWLLAYDNLSGMPAWLSNGLCVVSTGGAYTTRALYTNDEEISLRVKRPVIVNGIDDMTTRPDFADRAIMVSLPPIPPDRRREEGEFWEKFRAAQPRILGALFSTVAGGLRERPDVDLPTRPRMADFARWGVAIERTLGWPACSFLRAYQGNLAESADTALGADPVAFAIAEFITAKPSGEWESTMSELLKALDARVPDHRKGREWPRSAQSLGSRIRRVGPLLRREGIEVTPIGRSRTQRLFRITRIETLAESSSCSSNVVTTHEISGLPGDDPPLGPCARGDQTSPQVTNRDKDTPRQSGFVTGGSSSVTDGHDEPDEQSFPLFYEEEGENGDQGTLEDDGLPPRSGRP
jgi:hypothetical protein